MNFKNALPAEDLLKYKSWLKENCGEEFLDWRFNFWRFNLAYGITIVDPEVEMLFKLKFEL